MRRFILLICFFTLLNAQLFADSDREFGFEGSYRYLNLSSREVDYAGLYIEWRIADYVSFYYSFYVGEGSDREGSNNIDYFHMPLGTVIALSVLGSGGNTSSSATSGDGAEGLLLLFLLPEGINFHIPVVDWFELIPFFGFGMDFYDDGNNSDSILGFDVGMRFHFFPGNANISLSPSTSLHVTKNDTGFTAGMNVGIFF